MLKYNCKHSERPDILADLQENVGLQNIHGFPSGTQDYWVRDKKHHMTKQNEQHSFFSFPWHQFQKGSHRWDETDVCLCRGLYPIPYCVCVCISHKYTYTYMCIYKINLYIYFQSGLYALRDNFNVFLFFIFSLCFLAYHATINMD